MNSSTIGSNNKSNSGNNEKISLIFIVDTINICCNDCTKSKQQSSKKTAKNKNSDHRKKSSNKKQTYSKSKASKEDIQIINPEMILSLFNSDNPSNSVSLGNLEALGDLEALGKEIHSINPDKMPPEIPNNLILLTPLPTKSSDILSNAITISDLNIAPDGSNKN